MIPDGDIPSSLDALVGLTKIKDQIQSLVGAVRLNADRAKRGMPTIPVNLSVIFKGNTGTGKTYIAKFLAKSLHEMGVLSKGGLQEVSATVLGSSSDSIKEFRKHVQDAQGGVLLIDEIHRDTSLIGSLAKLLGGIGNDIVVILSGLKQPIDEYFAAHQDDHQRWGQVWDFPDYSLEELTALCIGRLRKVQLQWDSAFEADLPAFIAKERNDAGGHFKNAWLIERKVALTILECQGKRLASLGNYDDEAMRTLTRADLPLAPPKPLEEVMAELDTMIGFSDIKKEIRALANTLSIQKEQAGKTGGGKALGAHMVITGNPGTGKTTLARKLGEVFKAIGLLPLGQVIEVDRSKLVAPYVGQTGPLVHAACDKAIGGVLFIDEAYMLKQGSGQGDVFGQEAIDTLMKRMEDARGSFIVVAAGYAEPMAVFRGANPGLASRFSYTFDLPDYAGPELFEIFSGLCKSYGSTLTDDAAIEVRNWFDTAYAKRTKKFANGRDVRNLYDIMEKRRATRLAGMPQNERTQEVLRCFTKADLPDSDKRELQPEEIFAQIDALTGLSAVKKEMRELHQLLLVEKRREKETGKASSLNLHFIFTGNPGTGKTTVAKLLGRLFKAIGLLPDDKLVERGGKDLLGQYIGQTKDKVHELVDMAMGGTLFIDEAYTLTPDTGMDSYSKEAIDTLLKRLEDDRGKFICIAAGYKKEMQQFLTANPGLPSRFTRTLHFADYEPEELGTIFMNLVKQDGCTLANEAFEAIPGMFASIYENRSETFGNAREVRSIWERTKQNQASRLGRSAEGTSISTIELVDLAAPATQKDEGIDPLEQLDGLIGMGVVKNEVHELINLLKIEAQRAQIGGKSSLPNLHMVLTGNPGTGKTTVARMLGGVFKQLGILKKGHVVETDRSGLVGQYLGETAQKTKKRMDEAMGGMLFVDEAYSLAPKGGGNDFGKEAIDTLLKRMDDDRGKFIVLAAGYADDMDRFLASNDGLKSRFTRFLHFDDYTGEEMTRIFCKLIKDKGLTLGDGAEVAVREKFDTLYAARDKSYANGRTARNLFEKCLQKQASRLAKESATDKEQLVTLMKEDIV
ncbi:MAG: AAA family ATPase [Rectinemataceae bacterium]